MVGMDLWAATVRVPWDRVVSLSTLFDLTCVTFCLGDSYQDYRSPYRQGNYHWS